MYRAVNSRTAQNVAVKQIKLEGFKEEEIAQIMQEVDLVKRLSHSNIIKFEGAERHKKILVIVLECVSYSAPPYSCCVALVIHNL